MMAATIPEIPDTAQQVKTNAAAANSVPQLRDTVVELAAEVQRLAAKIERLEGRRR